jgi:hypothetical protein
VTIDDVKRVTSLYLSKLFDLSSPATKTVIVCPTKKLDAVCGGLEDEYGRGFVQVNDILQYFTGETEQQDLEEEDPSGDEESVLGDEENNFLDDVPAPEEDVSTGAAPMITSPAKPWHHMVEALVLTLTLTLTLVLTVTPNPNPHSLTQFEAPALTLTLTLTCPLLQFDEKEMQIAVGTAVLTTAVVAFYLATKFFTRKARAD